MEPRTLNLPVHSLPIRCIWGPTPPHTLDEFTSPGHTLKVECGTVWIISLSPEVLDPGSLKYPQIPNFQQCYVSGKQLYPCHFCCSQIKDLGTTGGQGKCSWDKLGRKESWLEKGRSQGEADLAWMLQCPQQVLVWEGAGSPCCPLLG